MTGELAAVLIESGVSAFTGEAFCLVAANGVDGERLVGQLPPDEVRAMALVWLSAAEAAEHDAAVFALLTDRVGMSDEDAAGFLALLREARA